MGTVPGEGEAAGEGCTWRLGCSGMSLTVTWRGPTPQKPGTCPQDFTHCLRLEPPLCTNDSVCPGWHKCCPHGCQLRSSWGGLG
uniref:WAP domain-containing protein n=1 Tax=Cairina moschata TaxID=8855 RepID=A0A8C3BK18_CAIMO